VAASGRRYPAAVVNKGGAAAAVTWLHDGQRQSKGAGGGERHLAAIKGLRNYKIKKKHFSGTNGPP